MSVDKPFLTWEEAVGWLLRQPDQQQLVLDCYYDNPLREAAGRYHGSEEWDAVRELLPTRKGKALDVGAGRGIASYALAREGFEVIALEPDPSDLVGAGAIRTLAAETGLPIRVEQDYSESLPFADAGFDLVFARAVLHHSENLDTACREFFRVLKPGGLLIAIREHVISHQRDLPRFLEIHPLHNLYGGEHAYLLARYRAAIGDAGFRIARVIPPLHSPINFAPARLGELKAEVARRASGGSAAIEKLLRVTLDLPLAWIILRELLTMIDDRPGRLYSFVAEKR